MNFAKWKEMQMALNKNSFNDNISSSLALHIDETVATLPHKLNFKCGISYKAKIYC